MAQYYSHIESTEGGKDAAVKDYAEQRLSEIKEEIETLKEESRMWGHVLKLTDSVCSVCRGSGKITWYPNGTGPGQGTRCSVPCGECHNADFKKETERINKMYRK